VLIFNEGWMQPSGSASDTLEVARNPLTGQFIDGEIAWQFAAVTLTYSAFAGCVRRNSRMATGSSPWRWTGISSK
jgi:hypothetical protein